MLPRHLNSPFTMMVSLVHSASHSSILRDRENDTHTSGEGERESSPVSGEYDAPSLSSDSSQNIPQVATCAWIHTCSGLILREGGREREGERGREGEREGGREGGREGPEGEGRGRGREGGREGEREGEREGGRERGREGGRERVSNILQSLLPLCVYQE